MSEHDQHVYHHYDVREPEIDLEVAETTRGTTWKVEIKGCVSPEQAVDLYSRTASGLADLMKNEDDEGDDD